MKLDRYILNAAGEPRAEPDLTAWADWMGRNQVARLVGNNTFESLGLAGGQVSTIFLGRDQAEEGPPELWETRIIWPGAGDRREYQRCTGSREQAEAMHLESINRVLAKGGLAMKASLD